MIQYPIIMISSFSYKKRCKYYFKLTQPFWRLNNIHILDSIYQEIKEDISNLIDVYNKFKGENRSPKEIKTLIAILQEVSDLEKYKEILEEKIENYESIKV